MRTGWGTLLLCVAVAGVVGAFALAPAVAQRMPPTFPGQPPVGAPPSTSSKPPAQGASGLTYQKWEYRVHRYEVSKQRRDELNNLDFYGNEGWELCGTRNYDFVDYGGEPIQVTEVVFKRPRP